MIKGLIPSHQEIILIIVSIYLDTLDNAVRCTE